MSEALRLALCVILVSLLTVAAQGQVKVNKEGEHSWVIENAALRVTIDAKSAAFDVLDKRCGQEWKGVRTPPVTPVGMTVPAAGEAIKLDGTVGEHEWPAPRIELTAGDVTEGKGRPAPEEFSAFFHAAWRADGLLVAVVVRDNVVVFPRPDEEKWWEWDSIEFWVGGQQYACIPEPPTGIVLAVGKGKVEGAEVCTRVVEGGWSAEFFLPWPEGKAPRNQTVPFALGINDTDSQVGGRRFQLYFPRTWRHSAPETFASTVFAAEGKTPEALPPPPAVLTDVQRTARGDGIIATAPARAMSGQQLWQGRLTVRLEEPADVVIEMDREPRDFNTQRFTVLAPLTAEAQAELFGARYANGIAVRDDDSRFRGQTWSCYGSLDMPWAGYGLANGAGYAVLCEDGDDSGFILDPRAPGDRLVLVPFHEPEKGKLGYARRVRYGFVDRGGFVAMCKWYRRHAEKTGILKTLREKMRVRPQLERIGGAPDFWGINADLCVEIRRHGIRHAIVNDHWNAEQMEMVKGLGYLVSRYDNYEDMLEGDPGDYGRGHIPQDVVKNADGSLMTAWLTWDKKTQYMKRCSVLYEEVARLQVPKDLETHPYNARFIDVTTACGLRECYDEVHPCTRREDRAARERLARYVGDELKLVLGGEHGRWWGVPFYDYWEGMQSGGFYSWPAGHVGINLPEKREDIGEMYLEFGIGEQRRVPLWELTFGDCVVSTWYWGDSTGHLYNVAPEIDDRKDCFNLLYGTVPLYWVSQPYSFRWSDEKLRLRLLTSYFVTCPVHEQIVFSEMTDYRYLTEDRTVHQSQFAGGATVTVNFGEKPFTIASGGREYSLPQYGFLAAGKNFLAWRALAEGRVVTWVQTPTVLYCDAGGESYDFGLMRGSGQAAVEVEEDGRARVILLSGETPELNLGGWISGWGPEGVRLYGEDERMKLTQPLEAKWNGRWLRLPQDTRMAQLVWGRFVARPDLSIREVVVKPAEAKQGTKVSVSVELRNHGNAASQAVVALYLDRQDKTQELGRKNVRVGGGDAAPVVFNLATDDIDGPHQLVVVADPEDRLAEISEANNEARADVNFTADPNRWPYKLSLSVEPGEVGRRDFVVESEVDLGKSGAPALVRLDPATVRVMRVEKGVPARQVAAQFDPAEGFDGTTNRVGTLRFVDTLPTATDAQYVVLIGTADNRSRGTAPIQWDEKNFCVRTPCYEVYIQEGKLTDLRSFLPGAPGKPLVRWIASSDPGFSWTREATLTWKAECITQGPVMTAVKVHKTLPGEFEYTKIYRFYPKYLTVEADFNKRVSVWTRTAYWLPCHFADSTGNRAEIDGKGEGENVAGKAPGVEWFAAWTDTWAVATVNLSNLNANLSYWDAGLLGEVGFSTPDAQGLKAAYVVEGGQDNPDFAASYAAALRTPVVVKVLPLP